MSTADILYPTPQPMELFKKQEEGDHPLSYLCKICSKRFVSGRALGGHMRAHVPASMPAQTFTQIEFQKGKRPRASDEKSIEEKDDEEGLDGNESNLLYVLPRNPKRCLRFADSDYSFPLGHGFDSKLIDSSTNCDLLGKEISSWKALFGHMMCHSENHQDSGDAHLEESQKHETQDEEEAISESDAEMRIDHPSGNSGRFDRWMKGKGFKRSRHALQLNTHEQFAPATNKEEEDIAICLVMLANAVNTAQNPQFQVGTAEPESGDLKLSNNGSHLPKCIRKKPKYKKIDGDAGLYDDDEEVKKAGYKCTTCNKVFQSHQALGGHRSSHKKVNGCFSQIDEKNNDEELNTGSDSQLPRNFKKPPPNEVNKDSHVEARTIESGKKTLRVHECSICYRVFASGQALGGHMRCHWGGASDTICNKEMPMQQQMPALVEFLDLNLPAPVDDDCDAGNRSTNNVDSHGASYAKTQNPPSLKSWMMGSYANQGLFLSNNLSYISKNSEADGKVEKEIGFGRGRVSDFPLMAQSWLKL